MEKTNQYNAGEREKLNYYLKDVSTASIKNIGLNLNVGDKLAT